MKEQYESDETNAYTRNPSYEFVPNEPSIKACYSSNNNLNDCLPGSSDDSSEELETGYTGIMNGQFIEINDTSEEEIIEIPLADIKREKKVGKGQYGAVYRVLNTKTNEVLAMKEVYLKPSSKYYKGSINALQNEATIHAPLNHKNIINFLGVDLTYMISKVFLEYTSRGTLEDLLLNPKNNVSQKIRVKLANDVAQGMEYLHSKKIIHGDLKPNNVLIGETGTAKICDLGTATTIGKRQSALGDPKISSPKKILDPSVQITTEDDVWSYGYILLQLVLRTKLYPDLKSNEMDKIKEHVVIQKGYIFLHLLLKVMIDSNPDSSKADKIKERVGATPKLSSNVNSIYRRLTARCQSKNPPDSHAIVKQLTHLEEQIRQEEHQSLTVAIG